MVLIVPDLTKSFQETDDKEYSSELLRNCAPLADVKLLIRQLVLFKQNYFQLDKNRNES